MKNFRANEVTPMLSKIKKAIAMMTATIVALSETTR